MECLMPKPKKFSVMLILTLSMTGNVESKPRVSSCLLLQLLLKRIPTLVSILMLKELKLLLVHKMLLWEPSKSDNSPDSLRSNVYSTIMKKLKILELVLEKKLWIKLKMIRLKKENGKDGVITFLFPKIYSITPMPITSISMKF